jgi:hypothetical protein
MVGRSHDPFTGDDASFDGTFTLNFTSAWWTTRAALPGMRERGYGRIVSIGSGASKHAAACVSHTAGSTDFVDHHIDPTEALEWLRHRAARVVPIAGVADDREATRRTFGLDLSEDGVGPSVCGTRQQPPRPHGRSARDRPADPSPTAGDDRDTVGDLRQQTTISWAQLSRSCGTKVSSSASPSRI